MHHFHTATAFVSYHISLNMSRYIRYKQGEKKSILTTSSVFNEETLISTSTEALYSNSVKIQEKFANNESAHMLFLSIKHGAS